MLKIVGFIALCSLDRGLVDRDSGVGFAIVGHSPTASAACNTNSKSGQPQETNSKPSPEAMDIDRALITIQWRIGLSSETAALFRP